MTDITAARIAKALKKVAAGPTSDFDLNKDQAPDAPKLREAAVLIAIDFNGTASVLFTKRSPALKHHPGQVSFPGGKVDPTDSNAQSAALREAEEEVALPKGGVNILGQLPVHQTVTGFSVTPFVAELVRPFTPVPESGEVDEAFFAPLAHILKPAKYRIERRLWQNVERRYYTIPYGPYYIWGATARMLRQLAECVHEN